MPMFTAQLLHTVPRTGRRTNSFFCWRSFAETTMSR